MSKKFTPTSRKFQTLGLEKNGTEKSNHQKNPVSKDKVWRFILKSKFKPTGDQPQAIKKLVAGLKKNYPFQTLLGVTGSGKTFTMANVIAQVQKPTLVISHNKTLAAQLASEFKDFFPKNAVHYFVSYYDYYQPEAYIPQTDTYIAKDASINDEIDKLRHAAMQALLTRKDVIVVASVSCIYGIGSPKDYMQEGFGLKLGEFIKRNEVLRMLIGIQYQRNDLELKRGTFRVRGEILEIHQASEDDVTKIEFFGDKIEKISQIDWLTGKTKENPKEIYIFPAGFFVTPKERMQKALTLIRDELKERLEELKKQGKDLEAQRLQQRTNYDLEMMEQVGYVSGIENYSRYLDGRKAGTPPSTLMDYFPQDFLLFIDESHMTIPQIRGMYLGDFSRKKMLVDFGFRLPSCFDNRPLKFPEFLKKLNQTIFVSATPEEYEIKKSQALVEQLIRPTGLLDPQIIVRPTENQIDDLLSEIQKRIQKKQRILVTTLTKRMAEELAAYLADLNIKVHYLHAEVETLKRLEILRDLRLGVYDVVVGINLLREGLDLPEVSLVAILDADKEGYLRSKVALIQTMGRAARHIEGTVIMYADRITSSMKEAIEEVKRRRKIQEEYNKKHGITPRSIIKAVKAERLAGAKLEEKEVPEVMIEKIPQEEVSYLIKELTKQMELAAQNLAFEKAAKLRDQIKNLKLKYKDENDNLKRF